MVLLVSIFHCEIGGSVISLSALSEEARVEGGMEGEDGWTIEPNCKWKESGDRVPVSLFLCGSFGKQ